MVVRRNGLSLDIREPGVSYTKRLVNRRRWSDLIEVDPPPDVGGRVFSCWINGLYQVLVFQAATPEGWPAMVHLSIKRRDRQPIHDWRDLQRIKNELCGTDAEGIELYPAESRLVDEANQYHLWVAEPGARFPIGHLGERMVSPDSGIDPTTGLPWVQRPFCEHHDAAELASSGKIDWPAVREAVHAQ